MNLLAPLANLTELLAALQPPDAPAAPPRAEPEALPALAFEAILLEAREQTGPAPELHPPAVRPEPAEAEEPAAQTHLDDALAPTVPAVPLPELPAAPEERAAEPPAPVELLAPAVTQSADAPALALAPSLVNLVLGTAAGAHEAAPSAPAGSAQTRPEPERRAEPERSTRIPVDFEPLQEQSMAAPEPLGAGRERETPDTPRRESPPDSATARPAEAQPQQSAPARTELPADPPARRAEQADASLRAAQAGIGAANAPAAPAEAGSARDASAAPPVPRALPELPARGEIEVVRSVRVLAEQGGGRVHIRLDPPELGGLSLRVVVSDGAVHVSLLADQAQVSDLLQRNSGELRSALESHGLRLDQLDVGTSHADQGSGDARSREPQDSVPNGSRSPARLDLPHAPALRRYDVSTLGAVDLHV